MNYHLLTDFKSSRRRKKDKEHYLNNAVSTKLFIFNENTEDWLEESSGPRLCGGCTFTGRVLGGRQTLNRDTAGHSEQ